MGKVVDVGSTPGSGQNIGNLVINPNGSAPSNCNVAPGCWVQLQIGAGGGGGGGGGSCAGTCIGSAPIGSQSITQPSSSNFTVNLSGGGLFNVSGGQLSVAAGGSLNGLSMPDSGSNCSTFGVANNAGFFSCNAPVSNTVFSGGGGLPGFAYRNGGVTFFTILEQWANKDIAGGYPSLNLTGQIPVTELGQ